jgi:hypothetical protein
MEIQMVVKNILFTSIFMSTLLMAEGAGQNIEKMKSRAIENIDKEIKVLNDAKSCVASATNKEEFIACRQKAKIDLKAARAARVQNGGGQK